MSERQTQSMSIKQIEQLYQHDLDRCGFTIDQQFLDDRGLTETSKVRFTTNCTDQFDSESLAEIQLDY